MSAIVDVESVILTQRVHPFPFRTRKLSFAVPKILGWRRPGKIGHSRHTIKVALCATFMQYSSLAQSVEHMTVNHGVVGSSPTGGARKKGIAYAVPFFLALFVLLNANALSPNEVRIMGEVACDLSKLAMRA